MSAEPTAKSTSLWFWGGFALVILSGVILLLFAGLRDAQDWAEERLEHTPSLPVELKSAIAVTLSGGPPIHISPEALPLVKGEMLAWIGDRRGHAEARMTLSMNSGSDDILAAMDQRVPDFADWYYSLSGSYARLFHAAAGNLQDYLTEQLQERIFGPAGTAEAIDALASSLDAELAAELNRAATGMHGELARLLKQYQLETSDARVAVNGAWSPTDGLSDRLAPFVTLSMGDLARQGAATSAGAAASAVVVKKLGATTVAKSSALIAGKQAAGLTAALASKLGVSSLLKGGGAATGAGAGAALCAGTGIGIPLAPACALIGGAAAGVAAWVATDKAVLEADEWMNREEFEADLRAALADQRGAIEASFKQRYAKGLESGFDALSAGFQAP